MEFHIGAHWTVNILGLSVHMDTLMNDIDLALSKIKAMGAERGINVNKVMFMGDKTILQMGSTEDIFERPSDPRIKEFIQSIL